MAIDYKEAWSDVQEEIHQLTDRLRSLSRLSKSLEVVARLQCCADCEITDNEEVPNAQS